MRHGPNYTTQQERLVRSAWRLFMGSEVTAAWLRERFGLGKTVALRDMSVLARCLSVKQEKIPGRGGPKRLVLSKRQVTHLFDDDEEVTKLVAEQEKLVDIKARMKRKPKAPKLGEF